jgi:hypothetical protein
MIVFPQATDSPTMWDTTGNIARPGDKLFRLENLCVLHDAGIFYANGTNSADDSTGAKSRPATDL